LVRRFRFDLPAGTNPLPNGLSPDSDGNDIAAGAGLLKKPASSFIQRDVDGRSASQGAFSYPE
jgi:hypothetical protein